MLDKNEVDFLIEKERTTAQYFSNRLIDYLQDNSPAHFPEYYANSFPDIYPDDHSKFRWMAVELEKNKRARKKRNLA